MSAVRFFTDEDVPGKLAGALRRAGCDAVSTPEANRRSHSDDDQLRWAEIEGRVIVTFNIADFARLHRDWMRLGWEHAGIVVSAHEPIKVLIRRLKNLYRTLSTADMRNRLEYLSSWQQTNI